MKTETVNHIHQSFELLIQKYGFKVSNEINEDGYFLIEYKSNDFIIEIEKYHRELYTVIYKEGALRGINLFNLLDYLTLDLPDKPKVNYFSKEANLDQSYQRQINHISKTIMDNYVLIKDFFRNEGYEIRFNTFENYWKQKHPELYK
ncbi:MAG: hypothetical protein V4619_00635 [Bacteroidota bacterium]